MWRRRQRRVRLFDDFFVDHLHAFHARRDASADRESVAAGYCKRPDKKENILAAVEDQCVWLRETGFHDVDCFFKVFELALFGGRKPSNHSVQPTRASARG
jgi:tRNA (cmo5U34)-methyltransferase